VQTSFLPLKNPLYVQKPPTKTLSTSIKFFVAQFFNPADPGSKLYTNMIDPNRTHLGLQCIDAHQSVVIDDFVYPRNANPLIRWFGPNTSHGHYRTCQDLHNGIERSHNIDWDHVCYIDYKCFNPNRSTDRDLYRVLNNPQPIKILHIACCNDQPKANQLLNMLDHVAHMPWRNDLCIEYVYHYKPDPYTVDYVIEQIRLRQPRNLLQSDFFIGSMNLHVQITGLPSA
jgi:hypothetical protein